MATAPVSWLAYAERLEMAEPKDFGPCPDCGVLAVEVADQRIVISHTPECLYVAWEDEQ